VNFGILPLRFDDPSEYDRIEMDDVLVLNDLRGQIARDRRVRVENATRTHGFAAHHDLSARQVEVVLAGGLINWARERLRSNG